MSQYYCACTRFYKSHVHFGLPQPLPLIYFLAGIQMSEFAGCTRWVGIRMCAGMHEQTTLAALSPTCSDQLPVKKLKDNWSGKGAQLAEECSFSWPFYLVKILFHMYLSSWVYGFFSPKDEKEQIDLIFYPPRCLLFFADWMSYKGHEAKSSPLQRFLFQIAQIKTHHKLNS